MTRIFLILSGVCWLISLCGTVSAQDTWQERSDSNSQIYFHQGESINVSSLQEVIQREKPMLEDRLAQTLPFRPTIVIVSSQDEFNRGTGGTLPPWSHGVSFPAQGRIILKSPAFAKDIDTFHRTAVHELVHLYLAVKTGNNIPRWLSEGLAQMLSGEGQGKPLLPISRAVWAGKLYSLRAIEGVDRFTHTDAELAYLQSYSAVAFLAEHYGWETIQDLLASMGSGLTWDEALFQVVEIDQAGFEAEWRKDIEGSHRWLILLDTQVYLFVGATLLVLVAGFVVFRRRRQMYRKWEAEDGPQAGTM